MLSLTCPEKILIINFLSEYFLFKSFCSISWYFYLNSDRSYTLQLHTFGENWWYRVLKSHPFPVNKNSCKVALLCLLNVPTPCPDSFFLLFWGAKTKRPGALEAGYQSPRSIVEMIARLTISQRSFLICSKKTTLFCLLTVLKQRWVAPKRHLWDFFVILRWKYKRTSLGIV